ncbi:Uncharacterised protein [Weissella viridescens]|uniref:Uncharacterized protein n=1 Tax=Weissella viridescens TaxID=1629 RepID=A0A380P272_WEIVI|nr:Uncharacterised protein [Weissella viridescens]
MLERYDTFYQTDLSGYLYAASMHADALNLTSTVNKIRLDTDLDNYYNSGVLLMNLALIREKVHPSDILNSSKNIKISYYYQIKMFSTSYMVMTSCQCLITIITTMSVKI